MREFKLLISYAIIVPGVLNMLHNSTTDLYSHITYVTLCTNLFLYLIAGPLSYYTNIHIQLFDVYIYMHMHTVYIHHHNTHHRLVVVDSHARHAQLFPARSLNSEARAAAIRTCPGEASFVIFTTFLITFSDL